MTLQTMNATANTVSQSAHTCPDTPMPGHPDAPLGCGHTFTAVPDDEGIVDCPNCGIWFTPALEAPDGGTA